MTKQAQLLFQNKSKDGLIEVRQEDHQRWLSINGIEQSRLNTNSSNTLASPLDYYFLGSLLFIACPNDVLLCGLGGGTIAHFLHNKRPEINGLAIEINPLIVKLAKEYFYFPINNWQINISDLQHNDFDTNRQTYDLILIDIGEKDVTPEWLISEKMLVQLKKQLNEYGVLIINLLVNDAESFTRKLTVIRQVFNCKTMCASIPKHNNVVIYAFNKQPIYNSVDQLQSRVEKISKDWGLDYSTFLDQVSKENPTNSGIF